MFDNCPAPRAHPVSPTLAEATAYLDYLDRNALIPGLAGRCISALVGAVGLLPEEAQTVYDDAIRSTRHKVDGIAS